MVALELLVLVSRLGRGQMLGVRLRGQMLGVRLQGQMLGVRLQGQMLGVRLQVMGAQRRVRGLVTADLVVGLRARAPVPATMQEGEEQDPEEPELAAPVPSGPVQAVQAPALVQVAMPEPSG